METRPRVPRTAFAAILQTGVLNALLLAERFKLASHDETRVVELSDLVVARGGAKLREALAADEGTDINFVLDGFARTYPPIEDADIRARTKGLTMRELAQWLPAPEPVADKTGLEGRYRIDLRTSTSLAADNPDTPADLSIEAALAKLGLRLEKHKALIRVPVLATLSRRTAISPAANVVSRLPFPILGT